MCYPSQQSKCSLSFLWLLVSSSAKSSLPLKFATDSCFFGCRAVRVQPSRWWQDKLRLWPELSLSIKKSLSLFICITWCLKCLKMTTNFFCWSVYCCILVSSNNAMIRHCKRCHSCHIFTSISAKIESTFISTVLLRHYFVTISVIHHSGPCSYYRTMLCYAMALCLSVCHKSAFY